MLYVPEMHVQTAMADLKLDVKKMPLGQLSKQQIARGFDCLDELEKAITDGASYAAPASAPLLASHAMFALPPLPPLQTRRTRSHTYPYATRYMDSIERPARELRLKPAVLRD